MSWFFVSHIFFQPFYIPRFLRPYILRMFGAKVGRGVLIRSRVRIHWPWKLVLGDFVWIGEGAWLLNLDSIFIGDSVCISQEALLCTGSHDMKSIDFRFANAAIIVNSGVWVCTRAIVLAGSTVPAGSVISAGSVYKN